MRVTVRYGKGWIVERLGVQKIKSEFWMFHQGPIFVRKNYYTTTRRTTSPNKFNLRSSARFLRSKIEFLNGGK